MPAPNVSICGFQLSPKGGGRLTGLVICGGGGKGTPPQFISIPMPGIGYDNESEKHPHPPPKKNKGKKFMI